MPWLRRPGGLLGAAGRGSPSRQGARELRSLQRPPPTAGWLETVAPGRLAALTGDARQGTLPQSDRRWRRGAPEPTTAWVLGAASGSRRSRRPRRQAGSPLPGRVTERLTAHSWRTCTAAAHT